IIALSLYHINRQHCKVTSTAIMNACVDDDIYLLIEKLPIRQRLQLTCLNTHLRFLVTRVPLHELVVSIGTECSTHYWWLSNKPDCCFSLNLFKFTGNLTRMQLQSIQLNGKYAHQLLAVFAQLGIFNQVRALFVIDYTKNAPFLKIQHLKQLQHLQLLGLDDPDAIFL